MILPRSYLFPHMDCLFSACFLQNLIAHGHTQILWTFVALAMPKMEPNILLGFQCLV